MARLELRRAKVADRGVPAARIVEGLQVVEDRRSQFLPRLPTMPLEELELQSREERLGQAVVEAVADGPHGPEQAGCPQAPAERPRGVLAAVVGVADGLHLGRASSP